MQVYRYFSFPVLVTRKKKSFLSTLPNFRLSQERVAMPNHVISHVDQSSTNVTMIPTRWGSHWIMGWHAPTLEITLVRVLIVWVDLNPLNAKIKNWILICCPNSFLKEVVERSMIKYQANSSSMIMSVILMTTLFFKALILQGEIWCWSLLGLKGLTHYYSF